MDMYERIVGLATIITSIISTIVIIRKRKRREFREMQDNIYNPLCQNLEEITQIPDVVPRDHERPPLIFESLRVKYPYLILFLKPSLLMKLENLEGKYEDYRRQFKVLRERIDTLKRNEALKLFGIPLFESDNVYLIADDRVSPCWRKKDINSIILTGTNPIELTVVGPKVIVERTGRWMVGRRGRWEGDGFQEDMLNIPSFISLCGAIKEDESLGVFLEQQRGLFKEVESIIQELKSSSQMSSD